MPWKWIAVDCGSWLSSTIRTWSPGLHLDRRSGHGAVVGPGLHGLARRHLPVGDLGGEVELLRAVGQHRRVPSAARRRPRCSAPSRRAASRTRRPAASSIASARRSAHFVSRRQPRPRRRADPCPTWSIAVIPAAFVPGDLADTRCTCPCFNDETSSAPDLPGARSAVLRSVPLTARLCVTVPAFFTVSEPPGVDRDRRRVDRELRQRRPGCPWRRDGDALGVVAARERLAGDDQRAECQEQRQRARTPTRPCRVLPWAACVA